MLQRSRVAVLLGGMTLSLLQPTHVPTLSARERVVAASVGAQTPAAPAANVAPAAPIPPAAPAAPSSTVQRLDFPAFVETLRADALARGISEATVTRALNNLEPSPSVIQRDQSQAELVLTIDQYLARRLTRPFVRIVQ